MYKLTSFITYSLKCQMRKESVSFTFISIRIQLKRLFFHVQDLDDKAFYNKYKKIDKEFLYNSLVTIFNSFFWWLLNYLIMINNFSIINMGVRSPQLSAQVEVGYFALSWIPSKIQKDLQRQFWIKNFPRYTSIWIFFFKFKIIFIHAYKSKVLILIKKMNSMF